MPADKKTKLASILQMPLGLPCAETIWIQDSIKEQFDNFEQPFCKNNGKLNA